MDAMKLKNTKPCHCGQPLVQYNVLKDRLICLDGHKVKMKAYMIQGAI